MGRARHFVSSAARRWIGNRSVEFFAPRYQRCLLPMPPIVDGAGARYRLVGCPILALGATQNLAGETTARSDRSACRWPAWCSGPGRLPRSISRRWSNDRTNAFPRQTVDWRFPFLHLYTQNLHNYPARWVLRIVRIGCFCRKRRPEGFAPAHRQALAISGRTRTRGEGG